MYCIHPILSGSLLFCLLNKTVEGRDSHALWIERFCSMIVEKLASIFLAVQIATVSANRDRI